MNDIERLNKEVTQLRRSSLMNTERNLQTGRDIKSFERNVRESIIEIEDSRDSNSSLSRRSFPIYASGSSQVANRKRKETSQGSSSSNTELNNRVENFFKKRKENMAYSALKR